MPQKRPIEKFRLIDITFLSELMKNNIPFKALRLRQNYRGVESKSGLTLYFYSI
jgi:hypothetical protein